MAYLLIDFRHVAYKAITLPKLQAPIQVNGTEMIADTTVATFTIKDIWNKSQRGTFHTAVCLEQGKTGMPTYRAEYFKHLQSKGFDVTDGGYKAGRKKESGAFYNAVEVAEYLVGQSGISVYRVARLEADDLIGALVKHIKEVQKDTETPIYILTNDADHLPLVDEQVSVYMKCPRQYNEFGAPEYRGYFQVTPNSWDDFLAGSSEFGEYHLPYNAMLLYKLVKGDKSDNYKGACKGYGKVKFSNLTYQMQDDGVDFANVFRYYKDFDVEIAPVLRKYFTPEEVNHMAMVYKGINPVQTLDGVTPLHEKLRKPLQINIGEVQLACKTLDINIK